MDVQDANDGHRTDDERAVVRRSNRRRAGDVLRRVPTPEERPTLTVDEAMPFYRLSRASMYTALNAGQIPSLRVGRRILIPTAAMRRQLGLDVVEKSDDSSAA